MNILIIRVSAIGDVIHTLPAVTLLRSCFPHARIDWIVQKKCIDIVRHCPHVNTVWELENRFLGWSNIQKTIKTVQSIRKIRWDVIIDFQGIEKTALLLLFLRGKKYGFDKNHSRSRMCAGITNHHVTPDYTNIIQKNLALTSAVAYDFNKIQEQPTIQAIQKQFIFSIPPSNANDVDTWMNKNNLVYPILLCPNTTWESKHWPIEYWQTLIPMLQKHPIVLVGQSFGKQGHDLAEWAIAQKVTLTICPPFDLTNMIHLIEKASLVIAPDTGLLHLADYIGTQTIGIFCPTSGIKHGPFLHEKNRQAMVQIPCSHYYQKTHGNNSCMNQFTPEKLFEKVLQILKNGAC